MGQRQADTASADTAEREVVAEVLRVTLQVRTTARESEREEEIEIERYRERERGGR